MTGPEATSWPALARGVRHAGSRASSPLVGPARLPPFYMRDRLSSAGPSIEGSYHKLIAHPHPTRRTCPAPGAPACQSWPPRLRRPPQLAGCALPCRQNRPPHGGTQPGGRRGQSACGAASKPRRSTPALLHWAPQQGPFMRSWTRRRAAWQRRGRPHLNAVLAHTQGVRHRLLHCVDELRGRVHPHAAVLVGHRQSALREVSTGRRAGVDRWGDAAAGGVCGRRGGGRGGGGGGPGHQSTVRATLRPMLRPTLGQTRCSGCALCALCPCLRLQVHVVRARHPHGAAQHAALRGRDGTSRVAGLLFGRAQGALQGWVGGWVGRGLDRRAVGGGKSG